MIEKHLVLNDADPAVFYGVNNTNMQLLKALFPKLRRVGRGNVLRIMGDDEEISRLEQAVLRLEEYCAKYDIEIAIEPLRRAECNILNFVSEGTMMSALVNQPHIGTLGDTYHMVCCHEPYTAFIQAGKLLKHVHIGHTVGIDQGRIWPNAEDGENYREVFEALEKAGYEGRVSIEAGCKDMAIDGPKAFAVLDKARRG